MNEFLPFVMERWQSVWENRVDYNLSESGVQPLTLGELEQLAGASVDDVPLGYGQSNGTERLRQRIARLYRGASAANICVMNGSAEANFVVLWTLLRPGDRVVVVTPTYMQAPGLAASLGANIQKIPLHEASGWQPDPAEIERALSEETRLLVITNPNNPTGAVLSPEARAALVRGAARAGAWILADEVYTGAEREGDETPSFFGSYPKVIATGSLSKAYGLPGLRIGWAVAPVEIAEALWARKDYTTISPGELTDHLASLALSPAVRPRILARTRQRIQRGWSLLEDWMRVQGCFVWQPPAAGAIAWARYDLPVESGELAERLRSERSLLVVPGEHFEMEHYLRIGFGLPEDILRHALDRFTDTLVAAATT